MDGFIEEVDPFSELDEFDPDLEGRFVVFSETSFPVKIIQGKNVIEKCLHGRVLVFGPRDMPEEIKVVLNSEDDLQFHYASSITHEIFREITHK